MLAPVAVGVDALLAIGIASGGDACDTRIQLGKRDHVAPIQGKVHDPLGVHHDIQHAGSGVDRRNLRGHRDRIVHSTHLERDVDPSYFPAQK
jgi:hypothetical protein